MSDISKCSGTNCPLKESCWRHKAPGNEFWQAYFSEAPYNHQTKSCNQYWRIYSVGAEN